MKKKTIYASVILCMTLFTAMPQAGHAAAYSVQAAIREYIDANMPWPPGTARVDFLSEGGEAPLESRNAAVRIEPVGNPDYIGDTVFAVRFFRNGNLVRTETIRARIEVERNITIAARTLPAGTILADSDFRTIRKWVRRIHPRALSGPEEASGKRLTTQVAAGTEILAFMLKDAPLVRKGKMVRIVFEKGPMHIATVGLPEEDGIAGSIVRVRNITSNKIIYARVLSDSLVGIEY